MLLWILLGGSKNVVNLHNAGAVVQEIFCGLDVVLRRNLLLFAQLLQLHWLFVSFLPWLLKKDAAAGRVTAAPSLLRADASVASVTVGAAPVPLVALAVGRSRWWSTRRQNIQPLQAVHMAAAALGDWWLTTDQLLQLYLATDDWRLKNLQKAAKLSLN